MRNKISHTKRLKFNSHQFRRLTGITIEEFDKIYQELRSKYEDYNYERLNRRGRKRKIGGGNKFKLSLGERLLMTFIYYRTYVSYTFLSSLFGIDESNVKRNKEPIEKLLSGIFRIPEKKVQMSEDEIMEIFFDGMEQHIQKPREEQRKWYSGKKKRHTIKHQVVAAKVRENKGKERVRIKAVSPSYYGKTNDKKIYDKAKMMEPREVPKYGDSAYMGTGIIVPKKKPRGGKLTQEEKECNRIHASLRIRVEHAIGKMKIWRILSERYRNRLKDHIIIVKNVAGLHNLMYG